MLDESVLAVIGALVLVLIYKVAANVSYTSRVERVLRSKRVDPRSLINAVGARRYLDAVKFLKSIGATAEQAAATLFIYIVERRAVIQEPSIPEEQELVNILGL